MNNIFISKKIISQLEEHVRYFEKSFFISAICCFLIAVIPISYTLFSKESIDWLIYGIKTFPFLFVIAGFIVIFALLMLVGYYENYINLKLSKVLLVIIVSLHALVSLLITIATQEYFVGYIYVALAIFQLYIILYFKMFRKPLRFPWGIFSAGATEVLIGMALEYAIYHRIAYSGVNIFIVMIFTICLFVNWKSLEYYDVPDNEHTNRGRAEPIFGAFAILLFFFSFVIYLFAKGSSQRNFDVA